MSGIYRKEKTREISFPLGGIGSGSIGLSGNGRLIDWEIFNRPNKGSFNGFSHFAIKVERNGDVVDARVLNGDLHPPYSGEMVYKEFSGFGFGPRRENMAGIPHFKETEFRGEYPFAEIRFLDESFPGEVTIEAFNPFIPLNEDESSLPAAFFELSVKNNTVDELTYTFCGTLSNPAASENSEHKVNSTKEASFLQINAPDYAESSPSFGNLALAVIHESNLDVSFQEYWYRGRWFDGLGVFWRDFTTNGKFKNRTYEEVNITGVNDTGSLATHFVLGPGEKQTVRFILSWFYPNATNYWSIDSPKSEPRKPWRNFYASKFVSSLEVASYGVREFQRLKKLTLDFKTAIFDATLPKEIIDAVSANISILKSPTCLRLSDGSFYAFEGCHAQSGCCEGSCTHVWNYAYALPYLFPKLERSMRNLEYHYNQRETGEMSFRLQLPIGSPRWNFRGCVDGQMGGVLKVYREWKICGDDNWLRELWPMVKKSIEYAWSDQNIDRWDPNRSGVMTGRQHHTLDMELFGANSWLTGFYLAALKAGAEIASYLGEEEVASEYTEIFEQGKKTTDSLLFNGEYYQQTVDLNSKNILESFVSENDEVLKGGTVVDAYWDAEHEEIKYQIGDGCVIDQVIAQWHANLIGLGEIFDPEKTKKALHSIYTHNFKTTMRNVVNPCRIYCLNDEAGTIICEWPEGRYKPYVPLTYSEETMHGYEYQVACHMIQVGMIDEGLHLVRAIRERYDGERRNPWNEIECGSNYGRSMASFALLIAYSGFVCDMPNHSIRFNPILPNENHHFKCPWFTADAWGHFSSSDSNVVIEVVSGSLELKEVNLPFLKEKQVSTNITSVFDKVEGKLTFKNVVRLNGDESLNVVINDNDG